MKDKTKIVLIDELYDLAQDLGDVANICPKDIKAHSWYCEDHYDEGCCNKEKCWCDYFEEHSWGGGEIPEAKLHLWQTKPKNELDYESGWVDGWDTCKKIVKVLKDYEERGKIND